MRTFLLCAVSTVQLLLAGCRDDQIDPILPFYNDATLTPRWWNATHHVGSFSLRDQDGKNVSDDDVDGRIYVASFFFAHCTSICPSLQTNLGLVQSAYLNDDDVVILSHTIKPEEDTVPVLRRYAQANNVQSGKWHLLTGSRNEIYSLARDSYLIDLEKDQRDGYNHSETFVLVDREGRIRGVYTGTLEFEVRQLIADIATLEREPA